MHHIIVTELIKSEAIRIEQSGYVSTPVMPFAGILKQARHLIRYLPALRVQGSSVAQRPVCNCGTVRQA